MDYLARFGELMHQGLHCASSDEGLNMPFDAIRERLYALAEEEQRAALPDADVPLKDGLEQVQLRHCRLAVYSWIDECLLGSRRPDATLWSSFCLQRVYFKTLAGGELFYRSLDEVLSLAGLPATEPADADLPERLRQAAALPKEDCHWQAIRVFAICLLYGFTGKCSLPETRTALLRACTGFIQPCPAKADASPQRQLQMQSPLALVEKAAYVLLPLGVSLLFMLYCADMLANAPLPRLQ